MKKWIPSVEMKCWTHLIHTFRNLSKNEFVFLWDFSRLLLAFLYFNQNFVISITKVYVTPDISLAKVYISIFPSESNKKHLIEIKAISSMIKQSSINRSTSLKSQNWIRKLAYPGTLQSTSKQESGREIGRAHNS